MKKMLKFTPKYYELLDDMEKPEAIYLGLNVSDRCNFRCKKCVQGSPFRKGTKLSLDQFKKMIKRAKEELDIKCVFIPGRGETFLAGNGRKESDYKENYIELVDYIDKLDLHLFQFSNGYYMDRKMVDLLSDKEASIVISIDSLNKRKYLDLYRGPKDSFEGVMKNLKYAREVFGEKTETHKGYNLLRLGINISISHENFNEIDRMKEFCGDDIMFICNWPIIHGNFKYHLKEMCKSEAEYEAFKSNVLKKSDNKGLAGTTFDGRCGFIFQGLSINSDGNVLLCPYTPETGKHFGNIENYKSFEEAFKEVKGSVLKHSKKYPSSRICFPRDTETYRKYLNSIEKYHK
ncbi:MAG: radical SAM protein [Candidatus Aenigmarchaeota archaeon]|nr:radical SAM protein [Candidatus Aenigmarchaeota archaeon]